MNVADLIIVVIVVIGFFSGLVRGFVRGALGLIGLFLGIMLAAGHYERLAGYLSFVPGSRGPEIVSFLLIFLAVIILVGIIAGIVSRALRLATLGWLDRLLGGFLGAGVAAVVMGVILLLAAMANLHETKAVVESAMVPRVLQVTNVVVSVLPTDARAKVELQYRKIEDARENERKRQENLV
jgi:uncharacterized membrane protein required for colicin V production